MKSLRDIANASLSVSRFSPPLFIQRYQFASRLIVEYGRGSFRKIVDIGCSDLEFFKFLKRKDGVEKIIFLDIDFNELKRSCYKVNPLVADELIKRMRPLTVLLACGDARFFHFPTMNADVVTMIEFIEHLHEEDLHLVMKNVFENIAPKLIIITTPNRDYNRFFLNLTKDKFRHPDHKFEWNKKEFETWCKGQVNQYTAYEVKFSGCGGPRDGSFCTQIGVFRKIGVSDGVSSTSYQDITPSSTNSKPCEGCPEDGVCNIVHKADYRFEEFHLLDYKHSILREFAQLRMWLKNCVDSWDCLYTKTVYVYDESRRWLSNMPNNAELVDNPEERIIKNLHAQMERYMMRLAMGEEVEEDHSSYRDEIPFTLKPVFNFDSLLETFKPKLKDDNFYFCEIEERFYFTVNTFCKWANRKAEEFQRVKDALREQYLTIEVDGWFLTFISVSDRPEDETEIY